jgi:hypothetical protein
MPKSERSEQMLREQQNEACFDFDANEAFEIAQQFDGRSIKLALMRKF